MKILDERIPPVSIGETMRLYAIEATGHYGGGCAIVAAESEEIARKLAANIPGGSWKVRYDEPEQVRLIASNVSGPATTLYHYEMGE